MLISTKIRYMYFLLSEILLFNTPAFVVGNLTKLLESSKQLEQTKMYESFYEKNFQSTFSIFQNSVYERKNTWRKTPWKFDNRKGQIRAYLTEILTYVTIDILSLTQT